MNGTFVNRRKIRASEPMVLREGDEICFGSDLPKNEMKYTFTLNSGSAVLNRREDGSSDTTIATSSRVQTDPDSNDAKAEGRSSPLLPRRSPRFAKHPQSRKKLRLKCITLKKPVIGPITTTNSSSGNSRTNRFSSPEEVIHSVLPNKFLSAHQLPTSLSDKSSSQPSTGHSPSLTCPRILLSDVTVEATPPRPPEASPAASSHSPSRNTEVDSLFDSIVSKSDSFMLDEAIFGCSSSTKLAQAIPARADDKPAMDGATMQVMLAKKEREKERHQLLSSIKALQDEISAKNELLAKKELNEKKAEAENKVVSSMQEEFICVICQDLFISARTLSCSHSFCEACIEEWTKVRIRKLCPICREEIKSNPVPSIALNNAVSKLEVKLSEEEREERSKAKKEHEARLNHIHKGKMAVSRKYPPWVHISGRTRSRSSFLDRMHQDRYTRDFVIVIGTQRREVATNSPDNPIVVTDESEDGSFSSAVDDSPLGATENENGPCSICGEFQNLAYE